MEYISDTARNRTHNLFRPKREPIPLGHSDGLILLNESQSGSGGVEEWNGSRWMLNFHFCSHDSQHENS